MLYGVSTFMSFKRYAGVYHLDILPSSVLHPRSFKIPQCLQHLTTTTTTTTTLAIVATTTTFTLPLYYHYSYHSCYCYCYYFYYSSTLLLLLLVLLVPILILRHVQEAKSVVYIRQAIDSDLTPCPAIPPGVLSDSVQLF